MIKRCLLLLCVVPSLWAQDTLDKTLQTQLVETPPIVDGDTSDPVWQQAQVISDFHQLDPGEFDPPTERTEVRVLYDRNYLYVAARLFHENPEDITANLMVQRQRVSIDDRFILILDPFYDRRNGYFFEINPHGIRGDALTENNNRMIADWDGIWFAETQIDEQGWQVEIQIPFATLSFDPNLDHWGINFFRGIKHTQEFLAWSSQGRQDFDIGAGFAGRMNGISGINQGLGLSIVPSVSIRHTDDRVNRETDTDFEPSLDITYKPSAALTAALTLNTDFSATEVDDRQINLTRFSLFFPEKRSFFLQDAGIFEFGNLSENGRPFFSRNIGLDGTGDIVDLVGGLKLTGRSGRWNYGVLGVRQDETEQLDANNLYVGRVTANVLEESSVGMIATQGDPQSNLDACTLGVDFRYRDSQFAGDQVLTSTFWLLQTDNEGVASDQTAWGAGLFMPNDRHLVDLWVNEFGENFDPALGFVNRTGIREYGGFYRFRTRPEDSYWLAHNYEFFATRFQDLDGNVESEKYEVAWKPYSTGSDLYTFYLNHNREVLDQPFTLFNQLNVPADDHRFNRYGFKVRTASRRKWEVFSTLEFGEFFHGDRREFSMGFIWKPSPRFNLLSEYISNEVTFPDDSFTARLMRLKTEVAITNRWSWTTLSQFDNVTGRLGIDTRLRWIPKAGQDLFIVYNHGLQRDLLDRFQTQRRDAVIKGVYTFRY